MTKPDIAVTIGNPNGIGPEITAKALSDLTGSERSRFLVIGDLSSFNRYFQSLSGPEYYEIIPDDFGIDFKIAPGEKSLSSGAISFRFFEKAVSLAKSGLVRGIVTAPISKELIVNAGFRNFTDHTTYLAKSWNTNKYSMLFHSPAFNVILATIHIPLKDVSRRITKNTVTNAIQNAIDFMSRIKPAQSFRIAVCGLNPHAGENGILGKEDNKIILPVVQEFKNKGWNVSGPLPADTVFFYANKGAYDMVVAMYHDQGLAPFKLLHLNDGVNVTWGLPIVRTSPDHGTAFDIAGKGIADAGSMLSAIKLAQALLTLR